MTIAGIDSISTSNSLGSTSISIQFDLDRSIDLNAPLEWRAIVFQEAFGQAVAVYQGALSILTPALADWMPPVLTISAQNNRGLDELWAKNMEHKERMEASGEFAARRGSQAVGWMRDLLQERLFAALQADAAVARRMAELEGEVRAGVRTPALAVGELVEMMGLGRPPSEGGIE
jgi:hypothetical protein